MWHGSHNSSGRGLAIQRRASAMWVASRPVALLLIVFTLSCSRSRPVVLDLAEVAPFADYAAPWTLILFGTPTAEAHHGPGLVPVDWDRGTDPSAWAAAKAEAILRWPDPAPRAALLDLAPYPGLRDQAVDLTLNGHPLTRLDLTGARRRYRVELPVEAQISGRNVLSFSFAQGSARQKPYRLHLAAALHAIAVGPADNPALREAISADAPPLLSTTPANGRSTLVLLQTGRSALRFAFQTPAEAELRFTPGLSPGARANGRGVTLAVRLEEENGGTRELWRERIDGGHAWHREVRLPLGVAPGTVVGLSFEVEDGARAWASWSAPRLLGRGPVAPRIGAPAADQQQPPDDGRLTALRRSLADKNVLLVLLDAARAREFSCYGYSRPTTPEIDRIAREGVIFEEAMSPVGFTLLAVGSLWTSQLPDEHHNGLPYNARLPRGATTLAEVLSKAGVSTTAFVHNAFAGTTFGLDQGFTEFEELHRRFPRGGAEVFTQTVGPWLRQRRPRRFFAALHIREPHFPYLPPAPYNTLFGPDAPLPREAKAELTWLTDVNWQRRTARPEEIAHLVRLYDANLRYADAQVGELRRVLEAERLWDKTVVMVIADHGDALFEHRFIGHLNQVYEEILHIPLILRIPGGPAGLRVAGLTDLTDVAPTIADVFGLSAPSFRGQSLLPRLFGAPGKEAIVARTAEEQPKYALRHGSFKLIHYSARGTQELFDLAQDPDEHDDLAARRPLRTSFYRQVLHRFIVEMRRLPKPQAETVELTEEQKESLRALGYLR